MSRELKAYIYNRLTGCQEFLDLVDTNAGLRRMDRPSKADFVTCVCFGRVVRSNVAGKERRPLQFQTVTFSLWERKELTSMGDLVLEDIETLLMKLFVWSGDAGYPGQNCVGENPGILIYGAELAETPDQPNHDEPFQAWTKTIRIRFLVQMATCLPIADDCSPCAPVAEDDQSIPEAVFAGSAFTLVQPLQEHLIPDADLYVANPNINTATFDEHKKADSIAIAYTSPSIVLQLSSDWFQGIQDFMTEADFWHVGGFDEAHRLEHPSYSNLWLVRPSVSLADRLADYVISNLPAYFSGVFIDEAPDLPTHYLNAFRTADEWVESELAAVTAAWEAMHLHYQARLKAHWGSTKAIVPNSAGKAYVNADGIWIEHEHVISEGMDWALERFQAQKENWLAHPNRFIHPNSEIASVLNVKSGPTLDPEFSIPGLAWPGLES